MKKITLILVYFLIGNILYSQTQSENIGVTQPVPSVSSLATYNNLPVSVQTGVPNIAYPLINLPTNNQYANIDLQLSYHIGNVSNDTWAGEVGIGWSLLGQGVISREILSDFDEKFDDASSHYYSRNEFDDIYNFNIPGESGKFRMIRNEINNTFELVKLSPFTSKVEYTRTGNTATLIIDSFMITSDEGIKYRFQDYNISTMSVWLWDPPFGGGSQIGDLKYRSAFYLTSISDEKDQELVKFSYIKDIKYVLGTGNNITESETNKLSRIEVKDRGVIEFNYDKNELLDKKNDRFSINNIILKTIHNHFVKKYKFEYDYSPYRRLKSYKQVDISDNEIEKYKFDYQTISSPVSEEDPVSWSVLKNIKLPTAGNIEYNFDLVRSYSTEIVETGPPPIELGHVSFDRYNDAKKYYFTLTESKQVMIDFSHLMLGETPWYLNFYKRNGNIYENLPYSIDSSFPSMRKRTLPAGEYYVSLDNLDPSATLSGAVYFHAYYAAPSDTTIVLNPTKNRLLRLKNIKYFKEADINYLTVPSKIEEYEYNKFDEPSVTSGYYTNEGTAPDLKPVNPIVVYKNVKVTNGNGYTKYYFKAADTYPTEYTIDRDRNFWPHFNIMRDGQLDKKEYYNSGNDKLMEEKFEYILDEYYSPMYLSAPSLMGGNFYLKTSWIKNQKVTAKNYFGGRATETISEFTRNSTNYKISTKKETTSDRTIQETSYKYAIDKGNQRLIAANKIGIPLETEVKKNNKTISKTETLYNDPLHLFPTSIQSLDIQSNTLNTEATYDRYDANGNPLQYTTKAGIPTTIIWGYNQTQPIAKIEGAKLQDIPQNLIDSIVNTSNSDAQIGSEASESVLIFALDNFRIHSALSGYQITTYTYDPLIGVRSITSPSGMREVYLYNTSNRLKEIRENSSAGRILKEYQYHYKN